MISSPLRFEHPCGQKRERETTRRAGAAANLLFLENGCTFYNRQIILLNIVLLKSSWVQKALAAHQRYLGKVRQAREIKFTQFYRFMTNGSQNKKTNFC